MKNSDSYSDDYFPKYDKYTETHKLLKLADFNNLESGDKLYLAAFSFGENKWFKFVFEFDYLENPKSKFKHYIKKFIHGYSNYTQDLPLWATKQNTIKFAISTDESEIFLDKPIRKSSSSKKSRPSPGESATLFRTGTKKQGNDENIWIVVENKVGVKRWQKY